MEKSRNLLNNDVNIEREKTDLELYSEQFDILIRDFGKRQISAQAFSAAHQELRQQLYGEGGDRE